MSVVFQFRFNTNKGGQLLSLYASPWKEFMTYVFRVPRNVHTYERLKSIKRETPRDIKTTDIIDAVFEVNPDGGRRLVECSVLFDVTPFDLQCFCLAVLGCSGNVVRGESL